MTGTTFPLHVDEVTPEWLTTVLRESGVLSEGAVAGVSCTRVGEEAGFLSTVARVDIEYDRERSIAPASLVMKLQPDAGRFAAFETDLHAFDREIRFYREVAPRVPARLAKLYAAPQRGPHAAILLEDLSFARVGDQVVGIHTDQVIAAVRAMGQIQARYWNNDALRALAWMPLDNHFDSDFAEHWPRYAELFEDVLPAAGVAVGEAMCASMPEVHRRMTSRPRTIAHNDLRADNVFFFDGESGEEALIIDWQIASRSMGAFDVARLLGGSEPPAERRGHQFEVLRAWYETICGDGVANYSWDEAQDDFRLGALAALACPVHFISDAPEAGSRSEALFAAMGRRLFSSAVEVDALGVLSS